MKNHYLKFYHFIDNLNIKNIENLHKNVGLIYRNYNKKPSEHEICKFKNYCKKNGKKFFLSNNVKLSIKLNLDGVYLPSFYKGFKHLNFSYNKQFEIIGSAHSYKEIKNKELQQVNKIFISSLFKKNKNFLGINRFKLLSNLTKKKVVALGGVSKKNLKSLKLLKNNEFAGISYFE